MLITLALILFVCIEATAGLFPAGGKDGFHRYQDQNMTIKWGTDQFTDGHVNIKLWNEETKTFYVVANNIADSLGTYTYLVSTSIPVSNKYKLYIESVEGDFNCISEDYFTINEEQGQLPSNQVKNEKIPSSIMIYPNPSNGTYSIACDDVISELKVYSLEGVLITPSNLIFNTDNEAQVDISGMPNGVYILHIKVQNGQTCIEKIIKE